MEAPCSHPAGCNPYALHKCYAPSRAEAAVPPETLPEDLPMGACVYQWQGAEELDLEALDPVLEAREARDPDRLTLAMLEDAHLAGETLPLPELRWENPDGT